MVKKAASMLRKGDEIGKRMEVVGEEGIAIDDMIIYLESRALRVQLLAAKCFR